MLAGRGVGLGFQSELRVGAVERDGELGGGDALRAGGHDEVHVHGILEVVESGQLHGDFHLAALGKGLRGWLTQRDGRGGDFERDGQRVERGVHIARLGLVRHRLHRGLCGGLLGLGFLGLGFRVLHGFVGGGLGLGGSGDFGGGVLGFLRGFRGGGGFCVSGFRRGFGGFRRVHVGAHLALRAGLEPEGVLAGRELLLGEIQHELD